MKHKMIGIALLVLILVGIAIFTHILIRRERRTGLKDLHSKGNQIVSLIALHSIHDFEGGKRDFFIRTLMEYSYNQGLVYCYINDRNGKPIVHITPDNLGPEIPHRTQGRSPADKGLTLQPFNTIGSDHKIYEFSKPIFENGAQTGTVRVGLKLPAISIISMERISLLGMLCFFVISAITIVYYAFVQALKPMEQFSGSILNIGNGSGPVLNNSSKSFGIGPMIEEFKNSMVQFKQRLEKIETNNKELASQVGVLKFEKNQVINILNSINFGIIITDIQDNVNHINDYMLNLFNKVRRDVIDSPLRELLKHEEILTFISRQEGFEQTRNNNHLDTTFPESRPGETFRISCSYLMDGDKELIGKIIMVKNVSREKEAEKTTQEFTAHLSHEMITPLTTIKSYSEMLMDDEIKDDETQKEFYNVINSETERLSSLIKNLLSFSKIKMGSLTLNKGLVKSDWFFRDCISAVDGAAQKKSISIHKHLPDNFPTLVGDKDQLKGAFINILSNAVKYTPENGEIHFALREENNMVIFDIKDTGYGMSEKDLAHIFDKFYRSSNPQIAQQQGTGLGLAITSEIIALHEGKIEVQSEVGRGTAFTIKIPKEEYFLGKQ
jgi:two-component system phosphate regulon sensor histidine kinase PhoR